MSSKENEMRLDSNGVGSVYTYADVQLFLWKSNEADAGPIPIRNKFEKEELDSIEFD